MAGSSVKLPTDAANSERPESAAADIQPRELKVCRQSDPGAQHSWEDSPPLRRPQWPAAPHLLHTGGKPAVVGVAAMALDLRWQARQHVAAL